MVDEKEDIKEYTVPGMKWEEGPAQEHGKEYKKISNEYVKIEKEDMKLENIVKKRFINLSTAKIKKEGSYSETESRRNIWISDGYVQDSE